MSMKINGEIHQTREIETFLKDLGSGKIREAQRLGLNEHADEQRRSAIVRISSYTGVPNSRMAAKTRVIRAGRSTRMEAKVRTADVAIPLAEYGDPVWVRDLNPNTDGHWGGSVSSMRGAEATGWNVRRQFPHAFVAKGQVVVRVGKGRGQLKRLSMAVLANELAKPTRPNVPAAEAFLAYDLEKRVVRHIVRTMGV